MREKTADKRKGRRRGPESTGWGSAAEEEKGGGGDRGRKFIKTRVERRNLRSGELKRGGTKYQFVENALGCR